MLASFKRSLLAADSARAVLDAAEAALPGLQRLMGQVSHTPPATHMPGRR